MKHLFLTLLSLFVFISVNAGTNDKALENKGKKLISGKVIDKVSGEELAGAEIKIEGQIYYSDLNGNFSAMIPMSQQKAIVKFTSYLDSEIQLDPLSFSPLIVELQGK